MVTVVDQFRELNVWQRGSERAPHKPLLALLALACLSRGQKVLTFAEAEPKLRELLLEFGPSRKSLHPEYPFWRLKNDGLWVVTADAPMRSRLSNEDPPVSVLRSARAQGAFPADVQQELLAHPQRIAEVAQQLLADNFPETLHQDILDAVGLSVDYTVAVRRRRDPNFRSEVLVAYQYRCAMCGLDLRLGQISVGLEAAHIKWHQARGPDSVDNGVAFCSMHHKLFDFGAFTIAKDHRLLVSEQVNGSAAVDEVLLRHHGASISLPRRPEHHPRPDFLQWHEREVFKQRALP
jgi:putative restriction endonuclease